MSNKEKLLAYILENLPNLSENVLHKLVIFVAEALKKQ